MSAEHIEPVDYVMDAMGPTERAAAEHHLAECGRCRAEVAELSELTASLAQTAPPVAPPPQLRTRLMEQISQTPQDNVRAIGTARPSRRRFLVAAAAAAVLVVGGGAATIAVRSGNDAPISAVQQVESAADAKTYTAAMGDGQMQVISSKSLNRSVIRLQNVPAAAAGKAYQAWFLTDTSPISAGLVQPGQASLMQGAANSATGAAVTVEPAGGSPQPTTKPVSAVSFS